MNQYGAFIAGLAAVFLIKFTCFLLGYLVIRMGHSLLEKGVKGEFKFRGTFSGVRADLVSASPGLLFLLLGVILIGYAMTVNKSVETTTAPTLPALPPSAILPPVPSDPTPR